MYLFTSMCNDWFLYSHITYLVCVIEAPVFVNTEHCAEKLNLFEITMSFPTQGRKHLNKLLPLDMELFNIRSFQCHLNFIFTISSVRSNIVWVILHLGRGSVPTERRSGVWALPKPSQEDHWEKREVSICSLGICAPPKSWWSSKAEKNHLTRPTLPAVFGMLSLIHLLWNNGQYKTIDI